VLETDVHLVRSRKQRRDVSLVGVMKAQAVPTDVDLVGQLGASGEDCHTELSSQVGNLVAVLGKQVAKFIRLAADGCGHTTNQPPASDNLDAADRPETLSTVGVVDGRRSLASRTPLRVVVAAVGVMVVLLGLFWTLQRSLIYLPQGSPDVPAAEAVEGAQDVTLMTADGLRLAAWHVPARHGRATVLVANGNAGHRGLRAPLAAALAQHGLGVLLFDYRGYAGNPGSPSENGLAHDVRAARAFLVDDADVQPEALIYFGESLGAGVVVGLAAEHPPAGLVLRSPFSSLADVGRVHYPFLPVRALLRDRYPVLDTISRVDVPTVVVLGTADSIVPPEQSRAVAGSAPGLRQLVEVVGADHNDLALLNGRDLVRAVVDLADETATSSS
jgi:uncharacterized protein